MQKIIVAGAASLLLAACGSPARIQESATSIPQRDLTLTPSAATAPQVASKLELGTPVTQARMVRAPHAARSGRVTKVPDVPAVEPTPVPEPVAAPVAVAKAPQADPSGRELAPGVTVAVIPASSATGVDGGGGGDWSEIPAPRERGVVMIGGGHGGRCSGRGRGPVSILR